MTTIYLVSRSGASEDHRDRWETVVCAYTTVETAQSAINDLVAQDQRILSLRGQLDAHMSTWTPSSGRLSYPTLLPRPKWPAGLSQGDITADMRTERDMVDAVNEARQQEFTNNMIEQNKELSAEWARYLKSVGATDEEIENVCMNDPWVTRSFQYHTRAIELK